MDPELRAALEALNAKMDVGFAEAAERDAETRQRVDTLTTSVGTLATSVGSLAAEMKATRAVAEAALQIAAQARDGIEAARTEARSLHEDTWKKIEGMKEGLSTHQRAESDRLDAAREETMLNHHVLPLEAIASSHQKRLNDYETRISAVEKQ